MVRCMVHRIMKVAQHRLLEAREMTGDNRRTRPTGKATGRATGRATDRATDGATGRAATHLVKRWKALAPFLRHQLQYCHRAPHHLAYNGERFRPRNFGRAGCARAPELATPASRWALSGTAAPPACESAAHSPQPAVSSPRRQGRRAVAPERVGSTCGPSNIGGRSYTRNAPPEWAAAGEVGDGSATLGGHRYGVRYGTVASRRQPRDEGCSSRAQGVWSRPEQAGGPRERWVVALMWAAAAQWCARALC